MLRLRREVKSVKYEIGFNEGDTLDASNSLLRTQTDVERKKDGDLKRYVRSLLCLLFVPARKT